MSATTAIVVVVVSLAVIWGLYRFVNWLGNPSPKKKIPNVKPTQKTSADRAPIFGLATKVLTAIRKGMLWVKSILRRGKEIPAEAEQTKPSSPAKPTEPPPFPGKPLADKKSPDSPVKDDLSDLPNKGDIFALVADSTNTANGETEQSSTEQQSDPTDSDPANSNGGEPPTDDTESEDDDEDDDENDEDIDDEGRPVKFYLFMSVLNAVVFLIAVWLLNSAGNGDSGLYYWKPLLKSLVGGGLLIFQAWYSWESVFQAQTNNLNGLLVGGRYVGDLKPGFRYAPPWFSEPLVVTKNVVESDQPGPSHLIYHGDPADNTGIVPPGYIPALRVTFAGRENKTAREIRNKRGKVVGIIPARDPFDTRLIGEVEFSYGFRVVKLRRFYETIGSIDDAMDDMDDNAVGGFVNRLQRCTQAEAMLLLEEISREVKADLQAYSASWGIKVKFARIKPFGNSHALNKSVARIPTAQANARARSFKANGQRIWLTQEGRGKASAQEEFLLATARGEWKRAKVAATPGGQFAMGVNAVQKGIEAGKTTFLPADKMFQAVGSIAGLVKEINNPDPPAPNEPTGQNPQPGNQPGAGGTPPPQPNPPRNRPSGRSGGSGRQQRRRRP